MNYKNILFLIIGLLLGILITKPGKIMAYQIKKVIVDNFPLIQNVNVANEEPINVKASQNTQLWEYWYQCHPNPTNEGEIRSYLNDRGLQGMEVVAAAATNGVICEYYKKPL